MWKVITTVPVILNSFMKKIQEMYPESSYKFDPEMTYETAVSGLRVSNTSFDMDEDLPGGIDLKKTQFPLFAFVRSHIIPLEFAPRQFNGVWRNLEWTQELSGQKELAPGSYPFMWRWSQFTIQFKLITNSINFIDTFEILYLNKKAVNNISEFKINFPLMGEQSFFAYWSEGVEALSFNKENSFYFALDFSVTLIGCFIVMCDIPKEIILFIDVETKNYNNLLLDKQIIK